MTGRTLVYLAIAASFAASGACRAAVAADTAAATRINATGLANGLAVNRFIVTYKEGSSERTNATLAQRVVASAMSRFTAATPNGARTVTSAAWVRTTATGSALVRVSRNLATTEAQAYMLQLAAD